MGRNEGEIDGRKGKNEGIDTRDGMTHILVIKDENLVTNMKGITLLLLYCVQLTQCYKTGNLTRSHTSHTNECLQCFVWHLLIKTCNIQNMQYQQMSASLS